MRLRETIGESIATQRLLGTHATQKDYCGHIRFENHRLMVTHETQ